MHQAINPKTLSVRPQAHLLAATKDATAKRSQPRLQVQDCQASFFIFFSWFFSVSESWHIIFFYPEKFPIRE